MIDTKDSDTNLSKRKIKEKETCEVDTTMKKLKQRNMTNYLLNVDGANHSIVNTDIQLMNEKKRLDRSDECVLFDERKKRVTKTVLMVMHTVV